MNIRIDKSGKLLIVIAAVLMLAALVIGCKHNVSSDVPATTSPVQKYYKVTFTKPEGGNVTVTPTLPKDGIINKGTKLTFMADPNDGYEVDKWTITGGTFETGTGIDGSTTAKVQITANTTVQVTFKLIEKYVPVPYADLDTYLKEKASEPNINYIKVTGLTKEKLTGSYPNASELGEILKKHPGKKVALKFDDAEILGLTDMRSSFKGCTGLVQVSGIPASVTDMWCCFQDCTSLKQAPNIPASVTNMSCCFSFCSSLKQAPNISTNVTNMSYCFNGCTSLTQVPNIPASVTDMSYCFSVCRRLVQVPNIPANVTNMDYCFYYCDALASVTLKGAYKKYKFSKQTFAFCKNLTLGSIKVSEVELQNYKKNASEMGAQPEWFAKDE